MARQPRSRLECRTATELLADVREYPAHLRQTLARHLSVPQELGHLADHLQDTLDEMPLDAPAPVLRASATKLRAQARHAAEQAQQLQRLAGELDAWSWLVETLEWAERRAEDSGE